MTQTIQLRRDTAAHWATANPILAEGEIGVDTTADQFKLGDGVTAWADLDYYAGYGGGGGGGSAFGGAEAINLTASSWPIAYDASATTKAAVRLRLPAVSGPVDLSVKLPAITDREAFAVILELASGSLEDVTLTGADNDIYSTDGWDPFSAFTGNYATLLLWPDVENGVPRWIGRWQRLADFTGGAPSGTAGGDLAGTYPNPTVPLGPNVHALTGKTTPVDADELVVSDSAASNAARKVTLANLWANLLKAKADGLYDALGAATSAVSTHTAATDPHGDRAFTTSAIGTHAAATDPHGDRAYAAGLFATNDALVYKGALDCSANANYPAADAGHAYKVSVAGKVGGASGVNVEVGDLLVCTVDSSAAGNQATVGANWDIIQVNLDGAVIGPSSAVNLHFAVFDGTSGRLIKDGGAVGTASALDVASSGDATSGQVVKGNDTRLLDLFGSAVKTAAYTVAAWAGDRLDTTGGTFAATLPTTPADRTRLSLKWVAGTLAPTVNAGGSAHFNTTAGGTTATLSLINQAQEYLYYAADNVWIAYTSNSVSALDLRYPTPSTAIQSLTYGTGADGDVVISGNTSVNSNGVSGFKNYRNLTVNTGVTLGVSGIVFVSGTLNLVGNIAADGAVGSGATGGAGGGGPWSSANLTAAGGGGGLSAGSIGLPSTNPSSAQCVVFGGAGATGGTGSSGAGGVAGVVYTPTSYTEAAMLTLWQSWTLGEIKARNGTPNMAVGAGRGGGGGGGDGTNNGGGGGGGGGLLIIFARHVTGAGTIFARGGAGASRAVGNVGGGGGGGGGFIGLILGEASHGFTLTVTGGAGGTGNGTGTTGSTGSAGSSQVLYGVA